MSESFSWECQPEAEALCLELLDRCRQQQPRLADFEKRLLEKSSTRLFDWIDHLTAPFSPSLESRLQESGFEEEGAGPGYRVFRHPGAQLPSVQIHDSEEKERGLAIKVESLADFLMVHRKTSVIEGSPGSGYRRALIDSERQLFFWAVERRWSRSFEPEHFTEEELFSSIEAEERWKRRPREEDAMEETVRLAEELVRLVGRDRAAWIVLKCERDYWERRNRAAQIQKSRQEQLGMGWANHDHHTFRSSRRHFHLLVRLFEILGFHCRERFYAGEEAGWGAQVMENPRCGLVLFLDVDLSPEELEIDFSHRPIPEGKRLGTVGLWCALHGDSILQGGMHHLEAQFAFDALAKDLKGFEISMMDPFSNFPYLKQAFTQGERWPVEPGRLKSLQEAGLLSKEEAERFSREGAVGSHLENLQRNEGYKGFNKKNVSSIIRKTDPRTYRQSAP